jgi:predicted nucleotide-binding protein
VVGGYKSKEISLTEIGRAIVAPRKEGDAAAATEIASLEPRIPGTFLRRYDRNRFPRTDIAKNVLRDEFDIDSSRVDGAFDLIIANGNFAGLFQDIQGDQYVFIDSKQDDADSSPDESPKQENTKASSDDEPNQRTDVGEEVIRPPEQRPEDQPEPPAYSRNVFVSHGKNEVVLDQAKELLELGEFNPIVAVEEETGAIPVPDKVFDAMRVCSAAIICVTADADQGPDEEGEYDVNPNVLIEIGAAYVLYERRVILLWDKRVRVPSNLQGLYRCAFEGDELTWSAGTRLQKALLAFKRGEAPTVA